jgi:hypothetical protein
MRQISLTATVTVLSASSTIVPKSGETNEIEKKEPTRVKPTTKDQLEGDLHERTKDN